MLRKSRFLLTTVSILLLAGCYSMKQVRESFNYYDADELVQKVGSNLEIRKRGSRKKNNDYANEWAKVQFYAKYDISDPSEAICILFASGAYECSKGKKCSKIFDEMGEQLDKQVAEGKGPYQWHILKDSNPVTLSPMYELMQWGTYYDQRVGDYRARVTDILGYQRNYRLKQPSLVAGEPVCQWQN